MLLLVDDDPLFVNEFVRGSRFVAISKVARLPRRCARGGGVKVSEWTAHGPDSARGPKDAKCNRYARTYFDEPRVVVVLFA